MKRIVLLASAALLFVELGFGQVTSLSHLFSPGKTIIDLDGDGLGEKPRLSIIIPDNPTAAELALAADIAARANFESVAIDFGLVRRESEAGDLRTLPSPILIGGRLRSVKEALREQRISPDSFAPNQGLVFLVGQMTSPGIACVAGSDEALLETGRAFFLRWPYFWEIWGRETSATYFSLENDAAKFFKHASVSLDKIVVRQALYEFPVRPAQADALQGLSWNQGQIKNLTVELHFTNDADRDKARNALLILQRQQRTGDQTDILCPPACSQMTFELWGDKMQAEIVLPRIGSTRRLLTPSFKERPGSEPAGKDFDILSLATVKGFYSDQDHDGIMDNLDSSIIIPKEPAAKGVADLATRLMLATAGASFPVVILDSEVESRRALPAPILVGANSLSRDLIKTGKLKMPSLENGWGLVRVVPKAFGKSSVLVIQAAETPGLEKTLSYFSRTFPYFDDYADGRPQFRDVAADFEKFLKGEKGAAEAYFFGQLEKTAAAYRGKEFESFDVKILLPRPNKKFEKAVRGFLEGAVGAAPLTVTSSTLRTGLTIFNKEKSFSWEADDAVALIKEKIQGLNPPAAGPASLNVSLGISESPPVRQKVRESVREALAAAGFPGAEVSVLSAYKPGFSWLTEKILPALKGKAVHHLVVRFSEKKEDLTRPKRTYAEPARWLQELYPVDEILARELSIPLERIEFEMKEPGGPTYEVRAFDEKNGLLLEDTFTPRTREILLANALPEWGPAEVTEGWLKIKSGTAVFFDTALQTDLEKFWGFYQSEVLKPLCAYVQKKTGNEPTFSKQPYFKRLQVELWASEPDYRLGLDEETISSLEALHDEIYFNTLDILRGITRYDPEDKELPQEASRSSAPGNILPVLHPSLEGGAPRVKVTLEDWPGQSPEMTLTWKEKGGNEASKKISFPTLKPKETRFPGFIYDGQAERVENLFIETDWEKEADYLTVLDILDAYRRISEKAWVEDPFNVPKLHQIIVRLRVQDQEKEERLPVVFTAPQEKPPAAPPKPDEAIVTTHEIISPDMALDDARRLGQFKFVRSWVGGKSYEGRDVPVLELYLPLEKYVSLPRLVTFKPTLQISARQHANEVCSTNYLLRFAERVARDRSTQEFLKNVSLVLEPMENPDGAQLAYELQKVEGFHSLHAGRYGSLGVDVSAPIGSKPLLPEAAVRTNLYDKWLPDIFLNLHGYPSHEWVQPFSNYTPYLFREYWIPKGWFTYFRTLSLPIYDQYKEAGEELMGFIVRELQADERFKESNRRFAARYRRWATRWAPQMDALEIHDGLDIYAKRRASTEVMLTPRAQTTFVEETPELMDETATGDWLNFLCEEGLAYLRAHVKYLTQAKFEVIRLEEESRDRVRIAFLRGRPARSKRPS